MRRGRRTRKHAERSTKQTKRPPLRNHVLGGGFRSVVAKVLFELRLRGTDEAGGTASFVVSRIRLDTASLDAAIFPCETKIILSLRRTGHGCGPFLMQENVKAEIHLAMKTICLFHNATLFFSATESRWPVCEMASRSEGKEQSTRRWRGRCR